MRPPARSPGDGDALGNCANGVDAAMPPLTGMYVLFLPSFPLLLHLHHAARPVVWQEHTSIFRSEKRAADAVPRLITPTDEIHEETKR